MHTSPIRPTEIDFAPRSLIFMLERFKLILCRFLRFYNETNLKPLSVNRLPTKFNFNDTNFDKEVRALVNSRNPLSPI